jgi:hypothetical protein
MNLLKLIIVCSSLVAAAQLASAQGTAFTYQGRLNDGANPANGSYDLRFALYDAANAGNQQGNLLTNSATAVTNGLFTVTLDFGNQFPGAARWLEIAVRTNGVGAFATLAPRQALTPTPYAVTSGQLSPGAGLAGAYSGAVTLNNPANIFAGNGVNISNVNALTLGGLGAGQFWQLGGNAGTTSVSNYLGTTDNQPLELHVDGARALRLEPNTNNVNISGSVNVIGGSPVNTVAAGVYGATIAGGGATLYLGMVASNSIGAGSYFAAIGGGFANTASGQNSVIGGGEFNTASNSEATVSGGQENTAGGQIATVGGGEENTAGGQAATVGGGFANTAGSGASTVGGGEDNNANGFSSTVAGGFLNTANGEYSFAAGQEAQALHQGAFVWADSQGAYFASSTNDQFSVRAQGGVRLVTSGAGLTVDGSPALTSATLGITIQPNINGAPNFITGSSINYVSSGIIGATISGGGVTNLSLVYETANNLSNSVFGNFGTVSGGYMNSAAADLATVGGGRHNTASGSSAVIGGGEFNTVSNSSDATVGGGYGNTASGNDAMVGGGSGNTASGTVSTVGSGYHNTASSYAATVSGGYQNSASAIYSTVPGGSMNTASGEYSFAAGQEAQALHQGAFVWADSQGGHFTSSANDQFLIRAQGGVGIGINNPASPLDVGGRIRSRGDTGFNTAGMWLQNAATASDRAFVGMDGNGLVGLFGNNGASWNLVMNVTNGDVGIANQNPTHVFEVVNAYCDGTTWVSGSDRNSKLDFNAVNPRDVLDKVAAMPITQWQYKVAPGREHIGPMAQDFHAAFGLNGADDKHIADVDEGGVALAAIQGLNQKLEEQQAENAELKRQLAELKSLVQQLAQRQLR